MKIAILHYHFNRGGVTQVVLNQLRGIDAVSVAATRPQIALVFGGRREGISDEQLEGYSSIDVSTHVVPGLEYDGDGQPDPRSLAAEIQAVLTKSGFTAGETVIHVHNHSLGKNVSIPGAIGLLAEDHHFLLQLHDFAEDLRPDNYRRLSTALASGGDPAPSLYPQAAHVHYAVLNGRDYQVFARAGVSADKLHQLPNPVGEFEAMPTAMASRQKLRECFEVGEDQRYVVYPVRGIRRKNLGELLLWSALGGGRTVFGVTLPPLNPVERLAYDRWTALAAELKLPCLFETGAGGGLEFYENLAAADALMSTSIAEGFGMVFLEAWLAGRYLVGRDLPEITADFVAAGVSLDHLYHRLLIPVEWVGAARLRSSLASSYQRLMRDYGRGMLSTDEAADRVAVVIDSANIDFAMLDANLQTQVIRRVHGEQAARDRLIELNASSQVVLSNRPSNGLIHDNAAAVRESYSVKGCGTRLLRLYESILAGPLAAVPEPLSRANTILESFLDVRRLHPIRFED